MTIHKLVAEMRLRIKGIAAPLKKTKAETSENEKDDQPKAEKQTSTR